ncbi:hypothetical protein, partial [Xanthomonas euvesicatoria]|uniref:hypothetical protein n=1 Tax=Xanthomonas euvesicatoria TaxID=456327 RepID=UPI001C492B0C
MVELPASLMVNLAKSLSRIDSAEASQIHLLGGAIVAVPHYGEFVVDIISIALSAPEQRRVSIFYLISPIPQPWKLLAIRKTRSGQGVQ